jgi:hypothetical protein
MLEPQEPKAQCAYNAHPSGVFQARNASVPEAGASGYFAARPFTNHFSPFTFGLRLPRALVLPLPKEGGGSIS